MVGRSGNGKEREERVTEGEGMTVKGTRGRMEGEGRGEGKERDGVKREGE